VSGVPCARAHARRPNIAANLGFWSGFILRAQKQKKIFTNKFFNVFPWLMRFLMLTVYVEQLSKYFRIVETCFSATQCTQNLFKQRH